MEKKLSFSSSVFWWSFVLLNNEMECVKSTCLVLLDIYIEQVSYFVLLEKDYPPVARAGNDVVIVLPVDHVTLYGNGSTDDKVDGLKWHVEM